MSTEPQHYEAFLNRPHPASRLAYLAEAVRIVAEEDEREESAPTLINADLLPVYRDVTREHIMRDLIAGGCRLPSHPRTAAACVDPIVDQYVRHDILDLRMRRLSSGAARPRKAPVKPDALKPHTAIVATVCTLARRFCAGSDNALHERVANFLGEGAPRKSAKLGAHHIRRAREKWQRLDERQLRAMSRRIHERGPRRWWERDYAEISYCTDCLVGPEFSGALTQKCISLFLVDPIEGLLLIEQQARRHPLFSGLTGELLAARLEAQRGLTRCLEKAYACMGGRRLPDNPAKLSLKIALK